MHSNVLQTNAVRIAHRRREVAGKFSNMLHALITISALLLGVFGQPTNGDIPILDCVNASANIDKVLDASNEQMKRDNRNTASVGDLVEDVTTSILGLTISTPVTATEGTLSSLDTLERAGNETDCSDKNFKEIEGRLKFDQLVLTFKSTKAKFWFMEGEGQLIVTVKNPVFNYFIANGTMGCRLWSFSSANPGDFEYSVIPSGLESRLVGYVLRLNLGHEIIESVVTSLTDAVRSSVEAYFTKVWCSDGEITNF
ncbi:Hypothetical protein NTJ_07820 [Nesidiocoris tenuis]|uniref:Uncharacterized protein n=1 Tax=Nesidiocoris tenuis TaxID=355587 RepID=A0ABN7AVW8_9HEMI|nr:Hypothetical protein NTJ_07820 [Nesidiocoris tenuis]